MTSEDSVCTGPQYEREKICQKSKKPRPCDGCALRRIRCNFNINEGRCYNCVYHSLECTNIRIKSGPRKILQKTRDSITKLIKANSTSSASPPNNDNDTIVLDDRMANISVGKLLPYLQVYQAYFYAVWPVISITSLTSKLVGSMDRSGFIRLDSTNASTYALCCALSGSISRHAMAFSSNTKVFNLQSNVTPEDFVNEAKRIRNIFDLAELATCDSILTSYFLHEYYINVEGGEPRSILYLRESITMSQILGLHKSETYSVCTKIEAHRYRKIYYMLLVSERYISFEYKLPASLNPVIEYPSLDDEENPELIIGYLELIKVFSVPGKSFFYDINNRTDMELGAFKDFLQKQSPSTKKSWISNVQRKLNKEFEIDKITPTQSLNVILSQTYIQTLTWNITFENNLIADNTANHFNVNDTDCFSINFPLKISRNFLMLTKDLPKSAFELNGCGYVKLLNIADSLSTCIKKTSSLFAYDCLNSVFSLINESKTDSVVSKNIYNKLGCLLRSRKNFISRLIQPPSAVVDFLNKETDKFNIIYSDANFKEDTLFNITPSTTASHYEVYEVGHEISKTTPKNVGQSSSIFPSHTMLGNNDSILDDLMQEIYKVDSGIFSTL